jgi:2-hydroxychromene-2-carboxylate isomerase
VLASIDVFFQFASPYTQPLRNCPRWQRAMTELRWRLIELAKVWEQQGILEAYKAVRRAKGRYIMRDAARVAADRGVSFVPFRSLPNATAAARLVVHRLNRCAPAAAQPFLLQVWRKLFAEGADIGSSEVLACCLDAQLHPEIELAQSDTQARGTWRAPTGMQLCRVAFGVPWIVADEETYFGQDRLYLLDRRLTQTGS